MPKYFDIHSHLNASHYEEDLDEVIKRLRETETHTIVVGTDLESSKVAADLARKHEEIYASIGVHPVDDPSRVFEEKYFEELVKHDKVVAIGECGLDFFHADKQADYERQETLFLKQLNFAVKHDKPIMIHARDAYEELLNILEPLKKRYGQSLRGNVHFFAGDNVIAQRFFDIGFSISFTGVITFTHDYDEVIKMAPLDKIMTETDAPYVTPVPHRGKRNEPAFVKQVVERIVELRPESEETTRAALVNNALSMIG